MAHPGWAWVKSDVEDEIAAIDTEILEGDTEINTQELKEKRIQRREKKKLLDKPSELIVKYSTAPVAEPDLDPYE